MNATTLKHSSDWFRVHSIRKIDDPSGQIDRRELVVSLDQYPTDISLGPNPRRPDPRSRVAKDIRRTLEEDGENFHLLNRGITVLAKSLEYDNKTERVRLHLHQTEQEEAHYGILDGGNTNAQINEWRSELAEETVQIELKKRFLNVQVLIPREGAYGRVADLLNDIKEARNNSVQVKQKSLADARHQYDLLKEVLQDQPYYAQISWREGEMGPIDVLQVVTLLMIYFPAFSQEAPDKEPNGAYGRKEKCLDSFLTFSHDRGEDLNNWIRLTPDMLRLFDAIQFQFPQLLGGRFGGIKEVRVFDEKRYEKGSKKYRKTPSTTTFLARELKYEYPTGWLYPLFAAFRALAGLNKEGTAVVWKRDPFEFWGRHGEELCARFEPYLKDVGYETKRIATSALAYAAMRSAVTDLYKDELLSEAGISA